MKSSNYEQLVAYLITNQNKFYRLAYSYTKNKENALDVVQNAICKALENYESLRNFALLKTWFYRILVNESLNYLGKAKREIAYEPGEMAEPVYIESAYEQTDDLYEKINLLSPDTQTIIKLHFYEDMTLKEISAVMNSNLSTVKTRLYAGLKKLKVTMKEAES